MAFDSLQAAFDVALAGEQGIDRFQRAASCLLCLRSLLVFSPDGDALCQAMMALPITSHSTLAMKLSPDPVELCSFDSRYATGRPDFFDLIVIDECHRGSADDDSAWR